MIELLLIGVPQGSILELLSIYVYMFLLSQIHGLKSWRRLSGSSRVYLTTASNLHEPPAARQTGKTGKTACYPLICLLIVIWDLYLVILQLSRLYFCVYFTSFNCFVFFSVYLFTVVFWTVFCTFCFYLIMVVLSLCICTLLPLCLILVVLYHLTCNFLVYLWSFRVPFQVICHPTEFVQSSLNWALWLSNNMPSRPVW